MNRLLPPPPFLHAVTNDRILKLPDLLDRAAALATGPDVAIHLRGTLPGDHLLELADDLRRITAATDTAFFVNDRADIARLAGADGLHLPAHGLPLQAARRLSADSVAVGQSTHTPDEARTALARGADYVFLGPIWGTPSHPHRPPLGLDALTDLPADRVVAIGGVTPERAARCREAGIRAIAAVTGLWDTPDPAAAAERFLLSLATDESR